MNLQKTNKNILSKSILVSFFLFSFVYLSAQSAFTLDVEMPESPKNNKLYLFYKLNAGNVNVDSAYYNNGKFHIEGVTPHTQRAFMYVVSSNMLLDNLPKERGLPVYIEEGFNKVTLKDDSLNEVIWGGTQANKDYQEMYTLMVPIKIQEQMLEESYAHAVQEKDTLSMKAISDAYTALSDEKRKTELKFFHSHLNSPVALDWLQSSINLVQDKSQAVELFSKMSDSIKNSIPGKSYANRLGSIKSVEVGEVAPDFTANDWEGNPISLSSLRGKYVLIDFWASWCGPCRRENPNLVKAYATFQNKNFTILGVSLDNSKDAWINAIEKDGLNWTQISDLNAWYSPIVPQYGLNAIPANFLLDPDGKIIARNLRGDELNKTLAEILN